VEGGRHPATHCPNRNDEDDTKSRSSQAKSVKKLEKEVKSMKKAFAQLMETKDDSEISESDSSQWESHFQATRDGLQFTQVEREFEPRIAQLFKQTHGSNVKLDLREVILLDSQSTMDLICNPNLVKKAFRSSTAMKLKRSDSSPLQAQKPSFLGRPSATNITCVSRLESIAKCMRRSPHGTVCTLALRVPLPLDQVEIYRADSNSWLWTQERRLLGAIGT
jgi:hypothetical protein